jgi:glycosyl hydrolase family 26
VTHPYAPDSPSHRNSKITVAPSIWRSTAARRVAAVLCGSLVALPAAAGAAAPTQPSTAPEPAAAQSSGRGSIYLGADGNIGSLAKNISHQLSKHKYTQFSSQVPRGRMITVGTPGPWAAVANMQQGTPLFGDVVRWAREIKTRHRKILLAFQHEPETSGNLSRGNATSFKQAFRRVVTVFRAQGVRNVLYTWQMTAWSFRTSPTDRIYAGKWYPGNKYVNVVGADAYNWNTCGEGRGKHVPLRALAQPVAAFARAHHKKAALPEFASNSNVRRASWLRHAHSYLARHDHRWIAAYYFQRPPTNMANSDCRWALTRNTEFTAYGSMARDHAHFRR